MLPVRGMLPCRGAVVPAGGVVVPEGGVAVPGSRMGVPPCDVVDRGDVVCVPEPVRGGMVCVPEPVRGAVVVVEPVDWPGMLLPAVLPVDGGMVCWAPGA